MVSLPRRLRVSAKSRKRRGSDITIFKPQKEWPNFEATFMFFLFLVLLFISIYILSFLFFLFFFVFSYSSFKYDICSAAHAPLYMTHHDDDTCCIGTVYMLHRHYICRTTLTHLLTLHVGWRTLCSTTVISLALW